MKERTYALYHGDEFIDMGTAKEIGKRNGMSPSQVRYYSYPSAKIRSRNGYYSINMDRLPSQECVICHREIQGKPPKLQKLEYNAGRYKQYYPTKKWNFCEKCFNAVERWIKKRSGIDEDT